MKFFSILSLLIIFFSLNSIAGNAPIKIGEEYDINIQTNHPYTSHQQGSMVFEEIFEQENASYVKLYFENFKLAEGDYVRISNPETGQEFLYGGQGKLLADGSTLSDFWSLSIFGEKASVQLISQGNKQAYGFDISKVAYGYPESQIQQNIFESICGNDDKEEIECYNGQAFYDRAKAVCRLVIGGSGSCTGWLLGTEGHIMTNNHCVGSQNEANNVEFIFNYQYPNCNATGSPTAAADVVAQSSTLLCTDGSLDYTLLELPVNPTSTYGFLSFRSSGPQVGERIYIPQHPGGFPKKISVVDDQSGSGFAVINNTTGGGNGTRVEYFADTEGGSSGSPVLGFNDHLVVALHNTGGCSNGGNRTDAIINDMGSCLPLGAVDNPGDLVSAAFELSPSKSCDGTVTFTNQSFNDDNRTWYFGDGNTSSSNNPTHTYSSSGNYTIQLIVQDTAGDADTTSQNVQVSLVTPPLVNNDTICGSASRTLTASSVGGGNLIWYDSPTGGSPVGNGNSFTTPLLTTNTSYYVAEEENTPLLKVGPVDNTFDGGQSFTSNDNWGLYFDVEKPLIFQSAKVYSGSAGNRTVELLQNGILIDSKVINIPAGESRINLDFEIDPGTQYLIKITGNNIDLFRNSGGANYPYTISGLVSITGNNTTSGTADNYYYYFYDWEVQEQPCISSRSQVDVIFTGQPSLNFNTTDANCNGGANGAIDLTVGNVSGNINYTWSNGSTTEDLNNLSPGTYSVTVSAGSGCNNTASVTVGSSGQIPQISSVVQDVSCAGNADGSIDLSMSNVAGTPSIQWSTGATQANLSNLGPGTYEVTVSSGTNCTATKSIVVQPGGKIPVINPLIQNPSCFDSSDGAIQLALNDTVNPVAYQWSNGASTPSVQGLSGGNYSVIVRNGNNCQRTTTVSLNRPDSISINSAVAYGQNNCENTAWVAVSGGNPTYQIRWDDPRSQNSDTAYNLCSGTYTVQITDQNGCTASKTVKVDVQNIGTGVEDQLLQELEFYPVPVQSKLTIAFPQEFIQKEFDIQIHNVVGQEIFSRSNEPVSALYQVDLEGAVPGAYLVGIRVNKKMTWKKITVLE